MNATMTSKGQLTVPKAAREALALKAGTQLTVKVTKDGALTLRPVRITPLKLYGILKSPLRRAPTIQEMKAAVGAALAEDDRRIRSGRHTAQRPAKKRK